MPKLKKRRGRPRKQASPSSQDVSSYSDSSRHHRQDSIQARRSKGGKTRGTTLAKQSSQPTKSGKAAELSDLLLDVELTFIGFELEPNPATTTLRSLIKKAQKKYDDFEARAKTYANAECVKVCKDTMVELHKRKSRMKSLLDDRERTLAETSRTLKESWTGTTRRSTSDKLTPGPTKLSELQRQGLKDQPQQSPYEVDHRYKPQQADPPPVYYNLPSADEIRSRAERTLFDYCPDLNEKTILRGIDYALEVFDDFNDLARKVRDLDSLDVCSVAIRAAFEYYEYLKNLLQQVRDDQFEHRQDLSNSPRIRTSPSSSDSARSQTSYGQVQARPQDGPESSMTSQSISNSPPFLRKEQAVIVPTVVSNAEELEQCRTFFCVAVVNHSNQM